MPETGRRTNNIFPIINHSIIITNLDIYIYVYICAYIYVCSVYLCICACVCVSVWRDKERENSILGTALCFKQ